MQHIFYILCPLSTKDSDCYLTRCSIRAAGDEVTSETTKNTQSMDQRKASKRPAQLAMFTGLYIAVVGMALLIYPTKLFGKTSKHLKACEFRNYKSMIQQEQLISKVLEAVAFKIDAIDIVLCNNFVLHKLIADFVCRPSVWCQKCHCGMDTGWSNSSSGKQSSGFLHDCPWPVYCFHSLPLFLSYFYNIENWEGMSDLVLIAV